MKQIADDTTLFLHNNENMIEAENIINMFSMFSSLRLNAKKTKIMKLGLRTSREK